MKAITLHQPWAHMIALGHKTIETRSWPTKHRGALAIHAARRSAADGIDDLLAHIRTESAPDSDAIIEVITATRYPLGAIVCTCDVTDCVRMDVAFCGAIHRDDPVESVLGGYAPDRYAWILENVRPVDPPVAARGAQGIWEWHPDLPSPSQPNRLAH